MESNASMPNYAKNPDTLKYFFFFHSQTTLIEKKQNEWNKLDQKEKPYFFIVNPFTQIPIK